MTDPQDDLNWKNWINLNVPSFLVTPPPVLLKNGIPCIISLAKMFSKHYYEELSRLLETMPGSERLIAQLSEMRWNDQSRISEIREALERNRLTELYQAGDEKLVRAVCWDLQFIGQGLVKKYGEIKGYFPSDFLNFAYCFMNQLDRELILSQL